MTYSADAFFNDPRIAEAKKLISEAVKEHQVSFNGIKPANPVLKEQFAEMVKTFNEYRGGKLYFPYIGSGFGRGSLVELLDGSVKYDFICGIGPHYWGHSHPDIILQNIDAAISDTVMQGNLQQNADSMELCKLLIKASGLDHCFLSTTGAMGNENALKIAFQKKFPASRILAFEHCFMGRTLAVSQITDKPSFREGLPINYFVDYIPFYDEQHPEESTKRTIGALKAHIARYPKQHAVMGMELIQGEGGFNVGSEQFFRSICQVLRDNNIAIFFDEVQTFGRTSKLFAFQHFNLEEYADLVSIGKLSQVCATLYKKEFNPRPGLLSQTFTGSTSAIRTGAFIIRNLLENGFYGPAGKIQKIHDHFVRNLKAIAERTPGILSGPFGLGAMIAFTPFDGNNQRATKFVHNLFEAGVMSFVAGSDPTRVRFLVPIGAVTMEDIDSACEIIETTLKNTAAS